MLLKSRYGFLHVLLKHLIVYVLTPYLTASRPPKRNCHLKISPSTFLQNAATDLQIKRPTDLSTSGPRSNQAEVKSALRGTADDLSVYRNLGQGINPTDVLRDAAVGSTK